jgi:replicative DNA helicase
VERTLLQLILEDGELLKQVKDEIQPEDFSYSDYRAIAEVILGLGSSDLRKVMSRLQDEKLSRLVAQLLVKPLPYSEKEEAVRDCLRKIKKQRIKRRRTEIQRQIGEKEREGDIQAVRALLREYQKLIKTVSRKDMSNGFSKGDSNGKKPGN